MELKTKSLRANVPFITQRINTLKKMDQITKFEYDKLISLLQNALKTNDTSELYSFLQKIRGVTASRYQAIIEEIIEVL